MRAPGAAVLIFLALGVNAAHAQDVVVRIVKFKFVPAELTVKPGTRVIWKNGDQAPHSVISKDEKTFRSAALDTDDTFARTFTKAGVNAYYCGLHPFMRGKIVVKP